MNFRRDLWTSLFLEGGVESSLGRHPCASAVPPPQDHLALRKPEALCGRKPLVWHLHNLFHDSIAHVNPFPPLVPDLLSYTEMLI